jgi:hypothetical protein
MFAIFRLYATAVDNLTLGASMTTLLHLLSPSAWSITGLAINFIGVCLLFRWGIPYYVRTGGAISIVLEQTDEKAKAKEKTASRIGWCGLSLVALGTAMQMFGSYN